MRQLSSTDVPYLTGKYTGSGFESGAAEMGITVLSRPLLHSYPFTGVLIQHMAWWPSGFTHLPAEQDYVGSNPIQAFRLELFGCMA